MDALLTGHDPNGWMLLFPLTLFVYYATVWLAVGRDPKPGTLVPQYGPPDAMSPAAVRYLVTTGSDGRSFAAVLAQLAEEAARQPPFVFLWNAPGLIAVIIRESG